jgi:hypothetical protein
VSSTTSLAKAEEGLPAPTATAQGCIMAMLLQLLMDSVHATSHDWSTLVWPIWVGFCTLLAHICGWLVMMLPGQKPARSQLSCTSP